MLVFLTICCLLPPAAFAVVPGGYPMPSLQAERDAYKRWGWTWEANAEPHFEGDVTYTVRDPDIHGDTEGDDLWTYLMMYLRTGQQGYFDRAKSWARYFTEDYGACIPTNSTRSFCHDRDEFGVHCHFYGWGLLAWYEYTKDTAALKAAEALGEKLRIYRNTTAKNAATQPPGVYRVGKELRAVARQLLFATRLAEVTGKTKWITLRDRLIQLVLKSPDWDARGMWFGGEYLTDYVIGPGSWQTGYRLQSTEQIGDMTEALWHVYRVTRRADIKERLIAMAGYVDTFSVDPFCQYAASWVGVRPDGTTWQRYNPDNTSCDTLTYWAPAYTIYGVNTLVLRYKLTGETYWLDRAKYFYARANGSIEGEPIKRAAPENTVHHFVDSRFSGYKKNFYLASGSGELFYTYLLFEAPGTLLLPLSSGSPRRLE
jgi:hypothetical protein